MCERALREQSNIQPAPEAEIGSDDMACCDVYPIAASIQQHYVNLSVPKLTGVFMMFPFAIDCRCNVCVSSGFIPSCSVMGLAVRVTTYVRSFLLLLFYINMYDIMPQFEFALWEEAYIGSALLQYYHIIYYATIRSIDHINNGLPFFMLFFIAL